MPFCPVCMHEGGRRNTAEKRREKIVRDRDREKDNPHQDRQADGKIDKQTDRMTDTETN